MQKAQRALTVAIVVYPGVQSLDVTGPLEVFASAQQAVERAKLDHGGYRPLILSVDGAPLETERHDDRAAPFDRRAPRTGRHADRGRR